jgi:hypothetical protein
MIMPTANPAASWPDELQANKPRTALRIGATTAENIRSPFSDAADQKNWVQAMRSTIRVPAGYLQRLSAAAARGLDERWWLNQTRLAAPLSLQPPLAV